jgi:hypothetical protein
LPQETYYRAAALLMLLHSQMRNVVQVVTDFEKSVSEFATIWTLPPIVSTAN